MPDELILLVNQIVDKKLRSDVKDLLKNPPCEFPYPYLDLDICPAGAFHHHSYKGGLIQHTICVTKIASTLCDLVEDVYGGKVNRDVVLAASLLHDIMKCYCYEEKPEGGFRTSVLGGKIDHLTLLVSELIKRNFDLEIIHAVASHHGDVGSTKPKTIEALIVSVSDLADSEFNGKILRAAEYLMRRNGNSRPIIHSSMEAINILQEKLHEKKLDV